MKGKKWLTLIGSVCLILVFAAISFMAASAPEEAKATPATHEQVELEIYSQPSGHTGYVLSFALATIINANSKWLRATCVESSANEAVFEIENHPNKAGTWVAYFSPATDYQASQGIKPFKKPNPNFRCISLCNNAFFAITTEDPNIKSLEDLAGKRVGTFFPGSAVEIWA